MSIRSAVAACGATLAFAILLATTATPTFAAKSNATPTPTPTVITPKNTRAHLEPTMAEPTGRGSKYEPVMPQTTIDSFGAAQAPELPMPTPIASTGSTVPGVPAGSVIPGGSSGAPLPSGSVVSSGSVQSAYQSAYPYGTGSAASTGNTGSGYPQTAAPTTATSYLGAAYPPGTGSATSTGYMGAGSPPGSASSPTPTAVASPGAAVAAGQQVQSLFANSMGPSPQSSGGADVRVVYVNSASNSSSTLYHFRVENVGSQAAAGISLSSVVREQSSASNAIRRVEEQYPQIGALAVGQAQDVVVTCTPQPGFQCVGGSLDAFVANDANSANNKAQS